MRYQEKTREELILLLEKLENENGILKNRYEKDKAGNAYAVKSDVLPSFEINGKEDTETSEIDLTNLSKKLEIGRLNQAEQKLKESEEKFRNVFEYSIVGNSLTTLDGMLHTNKAYCDILGYSNNELNNIRWTEITHPEDVQANLEMINSLLRGEKNSARWEKRYLHKNGSIVWVDINTTLQRDAHGEPLYFITSVIDITSRVLAEVAIIRAKEKAEAREIFIKSVADNLVDSIIYQAVTLPGGQIKYTYLSDSVTEFYGCTAEEAKEDANLIYGRVHKDDLERVKKEENVAISNMTVFKTVLRLIDRDGNIRWVSLVSSPSVKNGLIYWDGIMTDISGLKFAEYKLLKKTRLYNVLSQISKAIVHIKDKNKVLEDVCRIAVEYGNFRMAWIGLLDNTDQMIKPVTFAGYEEGYLDSIKQISVGDVPQGRGPSGQAFREGKHFVCNDFENDPNVALWKDEALKRNYHSSIGLPITLFGEVIGVFSMYASVPNFFDEEEIQLLLEVASDISYGIEALEIERQHNLAVSSLSVNEKKYREIAESIKDVVWVLDAESMHFIYVSPSVEKLRGFTPEEVMALPISAAIKPEYHERVFHLMDFQIAELLKGNISSEQYFTLEIEQPCKDGSSVYAEIAAYFLLSDKTGKIEIHGLTRDITDRKRAEESLRKSEERFHSIFNNLQDAFFQSDLSGNISLVSPSAVKMFGYSSMEEMMGSPVNMLYAKAEERQNLISKLSEDGYVIDYLTEGRKKDGTIFWASLNAQFRYESNKISGTEGLIRDVTERKIQEDRIKTLSSAVEQSPVMVVITDIQGLIEYVNPKFCKITGFAEEEVIGQNVRILRSAKRTQQENNVLWDTILTGREWQGEFENVKKNGEVYYEAASITPIIDEQGNINHFLAIKEDITEKKQLLSDLIKAKVNAEESDRLKSAFLANMSHEIRTPMNGIMGFIELLKEPNLTGTEQQAYIQVIEESGDRMLNLMNNLIDISRIESGEIKVLISSYDINRQLDNIFNFFVPEANKRGIKLLRSYNLSPGESMINTDMQKLDAILINLVKNAIKFTRNGSVEFGCARQGDNFQFFVKDSGVGIDAGFQEIIFDRFRQASESLSRPYEGAGLGLSISKAFVEVLGGKIWVESELGKGSTFFFILPGDINETDGILAQKSSLRDKTWNLSEELKVLIVEDDETSMNYMEIIAGSFCTKYLKASTGRDAVDIFRGNQDINLILMDIKMPVMDGLEATRLIRQFNRDVVIIAQTAYSMVGDREKALEAGCNDYISKPVNKDQLKELIQLHTKY